MSTKIIPKISMLSMHRKIRLMGKLGRIVLLASNTSQLRICNDTKFRRVQKLSKMTAPILSRTMKILRILTQEFCSRKPKILMKYQKCNFVTMLANTSWRRFLQKSKIIMRNTGKYLEQSRIYRQNF